MLITANSSNFSLRKDLVVDSSVRQLSLLCKFADSSVFSFHSSSRFLPYFTAHWSAPSHGDEHVLQQSTHVPDRDSPTVVISFRLIDAKRASCSSDRPDPSGQPSHGPKPHRVVSFASPSSNTRSEVMISVASDSRSSRPLALDTAWHPTPLSTLLTLCSSTTHHDPLDFTGQWFCVCLNSLA